MVVTFLPATEASGVTQERTALPSTCTVQAPHKLAPQPYLVPVSPASSRKAHNSMDCESPSTVTGFPLRVNDAMALILLRMVLRVEFKPTAPGWDLRVPGDDWL